MRDVPTIQPTPAQDHETTMCETITRSLSFEDSNEVHMNIEIPKEDTTQVNGISSIPSTLAVLNSHSPKPQSRNLPDAPKESSPSNNLTSQEFPQGDHYRDSTKKRKAGFDIRFEEQFSRWLSNVDVDWSQTPLGSMEEWPALWKSYVCLMTSIKTPIALYWTSGLVAMFNEAYVTIAGPHWKTKIGQCFRDAWPDHSEMWIAFEDVFKTGNSLILDKQLFFLDVEGTGELHETYWDVTVHPVYSASGTIEGVLCQSLEFTDEIITDRRMRMLSGLGKNTAAVKDESEFWTKFMESLDLNQ